LRAARKLPEQADFRSWRAELFAAYRSVEAREYWWHLPDGQTLRVIANPHPQGGMTWVYENVTERLDLESRYNALVSVQGATLDHLTEGVAVFGSDGRLRLHNPSFTAIWLLDKALLDSRPHVGEIVAACRQPNDDETMWRRFTACVAGLDENRSSIAGRMERPDRRVIDYATVPLPDGQTMVTFVDVTDTVQVERALVERNEALVAADGIKIEFVHHVSYELRSPLTNIIGFANLLGDPAFGPLTDKQHEYLGYITTSTNALLAIINNILDLATIDAGAMMLNLSEVDIRASMNEAAEGVQDRLMKNRIKLDILAAPGIGGFSADAKRLKQILFNLLSNAVGFSPPDSTVTLKAERSTDAVVFTVNDHGPGIQPERQNKVFDLFETDSQGSQHRGTGLGLSLVRSFVELHGGSVSIDSAVGEGATVTCVFPVVRGAKQIPNQSAA
jgi:signal transduction histidine kinase